MNDCVQCRAHFRTIALAGDLLAGAVGSDGAHISQALTKIVENEEQLRAAEAEYKTKQMLAETDTWPARPMMSDYCGLREHENVYLIAQVKNRAKDCPDFDPSEPPVHPCGGCLHRVPAGGPAADAEQELILGNLAAGNVQLGLSTSQPDSLLGQHREAAESRKALEIASAYALKGNMPTSPHYLDHCAKFSREGAWVVCVLRNPYSTCDGFKQAKQVTTVLDTAPAAAPATDMAPAATTAPPAGPPSAGNAEEQITSGTISDVLAFCTLVLGITLDADGMKQAADALVDAWAANEAGARENFRSMQQTYRWMAGQDEAQRSLYCEDHQEMLVSWLRARGDHLAQLLLSAYETVNVPLAQGEPPLTEHVVAAMAALSAWVDTGSIAPQALDSRRLQMCREVLIRDWPSAPVYNRQALLQMPSMVAAMRVHGDQVAGRREDWLPLFSEGLAMGPHEPAPVAESAAATTAGGQPAEPQSDIVGEAPKSEPGGPQRAATTEDLIDSIFAMHKAAEDKAATISPELALQLKLFHAQQQAQIASDYSKARHEASMAIISNMKT